MLPSAQYACTGTYGPRYSNNSAPQLAPKLAPKLAPQKLAPTPFVIRDRDRAASRTPLAALLLDPLLLSPSALLLDPLLLSPSALLSDPLRLRCTPL